MMLTLETVKNSMNVALHNNNFMHMQQCNIQLLKQHFPAYNYSQFSAESMRAIKPLQNLAQLLSYQSYFCSDHFNRFHYVLQQLPVCQKSDHVIRLKIFDYGCGQGLATLALLQHLKRKNQQIALEIHLVEPSAMALELAQHYVQTYVEFHLSGQVSITAHCCSLDQLDDAIFQIDDQYVVHLFSNVLDMADRGVFDLQRLTAQWCNVQCKQMCLAVSPCYLSTSYGFRSLMQQLSQVKILAAHDFSLHAQRYALSSNMTRLQNHEVKGRMLAFCFNTTQEQQQVA